MDRRATRQREAVLEILRNTRSHPTADIIYEEVKKAIPDISKGTVYRNLQVLTEEGDVAVLNMDGSQNRYEAVREAHYHFRCEKCGRVLDLDVPVDRDLDARISRKTGLKVTRHRTEFLGLCRDCQQG